MFQTVFYCNLLILPKKELASGGGYASITSSYNYFKRKTKCHI